MEKQTVALADSVKRMARNGMSQRHIAKALDISQPTVSRLLKHNPANEPGSLAAMIARNDERRAILDEIAREYNAHGESAEWARLWRLAGAI